MAILDYLQSLQTEELFQKFFLPLILTFAIFWGILEALRIFNRKINLVLALSITIAAAYGGLFEWLSNYMLPLGGYFGITVFFIVIFVGIAAWGFGRGGDIISPGRKATKIREEIEKLYDKIERTNDERKIRAYNDRIDDLERQYRVVRRRSEDRL